MYIKLAVSTNTDVQNRNISCRCSSLQGLPSAIFLVLSWKLDRVLLNLALIHLFQRKQSFCFNALLQGLFYDATTVYNLKYKLTVWS